jgi:hypothetical protein
VSEEIPTLMQEVALFIEKNHPISRGLTIVEEKRIIKTIDAGIEHWIAFELADGVYAPFSYMVQGATPGTTKPAGLIYRPDLALMGMEPDDHALGSLAMWLMVANRE